MPRHWETCGRPYRRGREICAEHGRELGKAGLEAYTESKTVTVALG